MKSFVASAAIAVAAMAAAPAAASTFVEFDGQSGIFGNNGVAAGDFNDTIVFQLPTTDLLANGTLRATISTTGVGVTNIDFSNVTLNGQRFSLGAPGEAEFGSISLTGLTAGTQTIVISGNSGGNASYSGTIAFAPGPIPEPAAWAMMIAGFGMVGAVARRRRTAVSYSA